jgi:hypothetical protein
MALSRSGARLADDLELAAGDVARERVRNVMGPGTRTVAATTASRPVDGQVVGDVEIAGGRVVLVEAGEAQLPSPDRART